jgi:hypothetical protein
MGLRILKQEMVKATRKILAGAGLSSNRDDLREDIHIQLGTPSTLNGITSNSVTELSHTHNIAVATQAQAAAGTTNVGLMTPLRVAQAIAALGVTGETTTNSNGTSVRFNLGGVGIQICSNRLNLGDPTANGEGTFNNPYQTDEVDWTYPQEFSSVIAAGGTPTAAAGAGARRLFISSRPPDETDRLRAVQATRMSNNINSENVLANLWAVGFYSV